MLMSIAVTMFKVLEVKLVVMILKVNEVINVNVISDYTSDNRPTDYRNSQ